MSLDAPLSNTQLFTALSNVSWHTGFRTARGSDDKVANTVYELLGSYDPEKVKLGIGCLRFMSKKAITNLAGIVKEEIKGNSNDPRLKQVQNICRVMSTDVTNYYDISLSSRTSQACKRIICQNATDEKILEDLRTLNKQTPPLYNDPNKNKMQKKSELIELIEKSKSFKPLQIIEKELQLDTTQPIQDIIQGANHNLEQRVIVSNKIIENNKFIHDEISHNLNYCLENYKNSSEDNTFFTTISAEVEKLYTDYNNGTITIKEYEEKTFELRNNFNQKLVDKISGSKDQHIQEKLESLKQESSKLPTTGYNIELIKLLEKANPNFTKLVPRTPEEMENPRKHLEDIKKVIDYGCEPTRSDMTNYLRKLNELKFNLDYVIKHDIQASNNAELKKSYDDLCALVVDKKKEVYNKYKSLPSDDDLTPIFSRAISFLKPSSKEGTELTGFSKDTDE